MAEGSQGHGGLSCHRPVSYDSGGGPFLPQCVSVFDVFTASRSIFFFSTSEA